MITGQDRQTMITKAQNTTTKNRGVTSWPFMFSVFRKSSNMNKPLTPHKFGLTSSLANVIYTKNPRNRYVSLGFYYSLLERISMHPVLQEHIGETIIVILKGSNAYAYLTNFDTRFPFSDLDVAIYINPDMSVPKFDFLRKTLHKVVLQVISMYKQRLDDMFVFNKGRDRGHYMNQYEIDTFKMDFGVELKSKFTDVICPFDDTYASSRHSFIMTNSIARSDSIVKVEVPHFEGCETIPLRKSPFVCSVNETIDFSRDGSGAMKGSFTLYRIKLICLIGLDSNSEKHRNGSTASADFIDLTISAQDDAELLAYWKTRHCYVRIRDPFTNVWPWCFGVKTMFLDMPDIHACIMDLEKMLNVYECPEEKRLKRQDRLVSLQKFTEYK